MRTQGQKFCFYNAAPSRARRIERAALALLAVIVLTPGAVAQEAGADARPAQVSEPQGLPPPNYPASPHRGVIDGWTGKPIPCRCRFEGKQLELGTIVCMNTHLGTVLTRCDIVGNNTSWMPSREPCTPKAGS